MPRTLRLLLLVLSLVMAISACTGSAGDPATNGSQGDSLAADALVQTGLDQLAAGDQAAARRTFRDVLDIAPGNKYAHYNLGVIAQDKGQDHQARNSYERALSSDDAFGPALYNLAILSEADDVAAAVALYRRATDADPSFAPAFMRLGFALVHLGEAAEGADFLQRGVELDPLMAEVEAPNYS